MKYITCHWPVSHPRSSRLDTHFSSPGSLDGSDESARSASSSLIAKRFIARALSDWLSSSRQIAMENQHADRLLFVNHPYRLGRQRRTLESRCSCSLK